MDPEPADLERFRADLDALAPPDARLGVALSGGPDSLALLMLAAAARPGQVEAATVDHGLRSESRTEAKTAANICEQLGVPHAILTAEWTDKPTTAIQERARAERYRLLAEWAKARNLDAIMTGHHADDQAETILMRLNRGAGIRGLAGMRERTPVPGSNGALLRPLLQWSHAELESICTGAGVVAVDDSSNADDRFERVRIRKLLSSAPDWFDRDALTASARHLASAEEALDWAVDQEWRRSVSEDHGGLTYTPSGAPAEILRRIVARAITTLAHEGGSEPIRARELEPLINTLLAARQATLRGVLCAGGRQWRFASAPQRRANG